MDMTSVFAAAVIGELQEWPDTDDHSVIRHHGLPCQSDNDCTACTMGICVGEYDPELRNAVCPFCGAKGYGPEIDQPDRQHRGRSRMRMCCGTELYFCVIVSGSGDTRASLTGYTIGAGCIHYIPEDDVI